MNCCMSTLVIPRCAGMGSSPVRSTLLYRRQWDTIKALDSTVIYAYTTLIFVLIWFICYVVLGAQKQRTGFTRNCAAASSDTASGTGICTARTHYRHCMLACFWQSMETVRHHLEAQALCRRSVRHMRKVAVAPWLARKQLQSATTAVSQAKWWRAAMRSIPARPFRPPMLPQSALLCSLCRMAGG